MSRIYSALEHHDYRVLDQDCICFICEDWRTKLAILQSWQAKTAGHKLGCPCDGCRQKMRARSGYLAALARRDLYSEGSWHAAVAPHEIIDSPYIQQCSGVGAVFMDWLGGQVQRKTDGWWENAAPFIALSTWFENFALVVAASGLIPGIEVRKTMGVASS
jgi:hypothetical protein